jgi:transposase-like protein
MSPEFISPVTDPVLDAVREWQNRPLDQISPWCFSARRVSASRA